MHSKVEIHIVKSVKDLKQFIALPDFIYSHDVNYITPLDIEKEHQLNPKKNPFYQHATVRLFLAKKNNINVGRISAHIDHNNKKFTEEKIGCFGFFESIDDQEIANSLLNAASEYLKKLGSKKIMGPMNFSTNEEVGLLVEGFEASPMITMPYNLEYYPKLVESWGLKKFKDLWAWHYDITRTIPEAPLQIAEAVAQYPGLVVRTLNMKNLNQEINIIQDVYQSAWSNNWGFVPMTKAEIEKAKKDFKMIADPELIFIAELEGKPAAICIYVPNLFEIIKDLKGKLFPLGWLKLLWRLKTHKFKSGRLMLLGIKKEYRGSTLGGLSILLYIAINKASLAKGYQYGELSWTLEDNDKINTGIEFMGGKVYKTYRIYEKEL